jgi:3-oxoadipate enol-lactonase
MPQVPVGDITMNYEEQGEGEPLVLIPYTSADNAYYAFQYGDYAPRYRCISIDLRGAGLSDKPPGPYSTEQCAEDVVGLMDALGVERAHVAGMSLGAAIGLWIGARHPDRVVSLALHSGWHRTDAYLRAALETWRTIAQALGSVPETVIEAVLPWCFRPETYANTEFIDTVTGFIRSRPEQPVEAFLSQCDAVLAHDASEALGAIRAPTLLTFGRYDQVTSLRFADPLLAGIGGAELTVFEDCSHAGLHENAPEFNRVTLDFMARHPA